MQDLLTKLQTILADPGQLFVFVLLFGIAVLVLHLLARAVGFILRLAIAVVIILLLAYFFF